MTAWSRRAFRQRLLRPEGLVRGEWDLLLQPRQGGAVRVRALVSALHDPDGGPGTLAWLLRELPSSASGLAGVLSSGGRTADGGPGRPDWEALRGKLADCCDLLLAEIIADQPVDDDIALLALRLAD